MNIGNLRYRVSIKEKTINEDTEGIVSADYITVISAWVDIIPIGGEIALRKYGVVDDGITMKMISRPSVNVKEQNVIVWKDKLYEIRYVAPFIDRYESLLKPVKI